MALVAACLNLFLVCLFWQSAKTPWPGPPRQGWSKNIIHLVFVDWNRSHIIPQIWKAVAVRKAFKKNSFNLLFFFLRLPSGFLEKSVDAHTQAVQPSAPYVWALIKCSRALPLVPTSQYNKCSFKQHICRGCQKRTLKCTPTPTLARQEKGALKQLPLEVLAERKTSRVLKRCPFPPTFFSICKSTFPHGFWFSARYLYMEPLYYGQILFNVLVGGRTAGAEIKMRKQSAPAVEVLIQKLTTVCWLIAFCLMCFQKPWFLFSVTQSQLRRDIKRPVKLKIPFKGAALLHPPSSPILLMAQRP